MNTSQYRHLGILVAGSLGIALATSACSGPDTVSNKTTVTENTTTDGAGNTETTRTQTEQKAAE